MPPPSRNKNLQAPLLLVVSLAAGCTREAPPDPAPVSALADSSAAPSLPPPEAPPAASPAPTETASLPAPGEPAATASLGSAASMCASLAPALGKAAGLLPPGFPANLAPHLVHVARRRDPVFPPIPIVVDGEVLFLEHQIDGGRLVVSRAAGEGRETVRTVLIPPRPGNSQFSSYQFDAAVGERTVALAAVVGKEAFVVIIDKKKWTVRGVTPLQIAEPTSIYGLNHPHIAAGQGGYGVALQGDMPYAKWRIAWTVVGEDGRQRGKPIYIDSSSYIEPRVAWTGSLFGVLSGRQSDPSPHSLGVFLMPAVVGEKPRYVPWVERDGERVFYVAGALVWREGEFHVAMEAAHQLKREHASQLVHAPLDGPGRVEVCAQEGGEAPRGRNRHGR